MLNFTQKKVAILISVRKENNLKDKSAFILMKNQ